MKIYTFKWTELSTGDRYIAVIKAKNSYQAFKKLCSRPLGIVSNLEVSVRD